MGACLTPYQKRESKTEITPVPCGKCENCRNRRASGWSHRLMQEDKHSNTSYFVTLTYDTLNVPINKKGFMALQKTDLQKFFKRLRKAHFNEFGRNDIKYFAVGEYGSTRGRPHYHIIIFNTTIKLIDYAWTKEKKIQQIGKKGKPIKKFTIQRVAIGSIYYGSVSEESVGYTLKYITKPAPPWTKQTWRDLPPQFQVMSKGLGEKYLSQVNIAWHKDDLENRMYVNIPGGKKAAMPRYYKLKIYNANEKEQIANVQQIKMIEKEINYINKHENYYHDKQQAIKASIRRVHKADSDPGCF